MAMMDFSTYSLSEEKQKEIQEFIRTHGHKNTTEKLLALHRQEIVALVECGTKASDVAIYLREKYDYFRNKKISTLRQDCCRYIAKEKIKCTKQADEDVTQNNKNKKQEE